MAEYISREDVLKAIDYQHEVNNVFESEAAYVQMWETINDDMGIKAADVQPVKYCRMIPLEPDCRGYTDVFICTNCHQHIHLGFIQKEYSGSYCIECGAEVKDGDTE